MFFLGRCVRLVLRERDFLADPGALQALHWRVSESFQWVRLLPTYAGSMLFNLNSREDLGLDDSTSSAKRSRTTGYPTASHRRVPVAFGDVHVTHTMSVKVEGDRQEDAIRLDNLRVSLIGPRPRPVVLTTNYRAETFGTQRDLAEREWIILRAKWASAVCESTRGENKKAH